jgi:hypothetical protein
MAAAGCESTAAAGSRERCSCAFKVHHSYGSYAPCTYGSYGPREANPSTAWPPAAEAQLRLEGPRERTAAVEIHLLILRAVWCIKSVRRYGRKQGAHSRSRTSSRRCTAPCCAAETQAGDTGVGLVGVKLDPPHVSSWLWCARPRFRQRRGSLSCPPGNLCVHRGLGAQEPPNPRSILPLCALWGSHCATVARYLQPAQAYVPLSVWSSNPPSATCRRSRSAQCAALRSSQRPWR